MSGGFVCPRCAAPLFAGQARDLVVHGCGQCGGVFLDVAGAHRFLAALPHDAWQLAATASAHGRRAVDVAGVAPCPACRLPMRRTIAPATGAPIDDCPVHGVWYDRHELAAIAHAVHHARAASPAGGHPANGAGVAPPRGRGRAPGAGPDAWGAPAVAGAAVAGAAVVGAAAMLVAGDDEDDDDGSVAEAAIEIGAEVVTEGVVEGGFEILGGVLGALFD